MGLIVGIGRERAYSFVTGRKGVPVALRIEVHSEDLTTSRFALSPLWELSNALRLLADARRGPGEPVLRPWLARARERFGDLARETDLGVILALHPPGWGADFLAPVPVSVHTTIDDLLAQGRATPPAQVGGGGPEALRRQPPVKPRVAHVLAGDDVAGRCADILAVAWQGAVRGGRAGPRGPLQRG